MGTGAFTAVARNLFVNDGGRTTGWGEEQLGDRATLWYGFVIPEMLNGYQVSSAGGSANVGERGKFWVDAQTLELLRIEDHADDIPAVLEIQDIVTTISYAKVRIGSSDLLLPQVAEMVLTNSNGLQRKNVTEFSNCREYASESVIRFDASDGPLPAPKKK